MKKIISLFSIFIFHLFSIVCRASPENENEAKIELTKSPSLDEFLRARHQRMPSFEFKIDVKDKKDAKKSETESKTPVIEEEFEFPAPSNAETEKNKLAQKFQNFKRSKSFSFPPLGRQKEPKTPVIDEEFEFPAPSNAETEKNKLAQKFQNFKRSKSFSFPPLRRQKESPKRS